MTHNQIIIILFGIIYFAFIIYTRRKGNFEEFSVAGRSLGVFLIFASICASYIGPAMTMGLSRNGFSDGMFLTYIATWGGVGMVAVAFLFAPVVRRKFTQSYSIGDVLGGPKSHDHKVVKIAVGIVSVWLMSSVTIAMSYAGGELVNNIFGFSKFWSIAIITTIVMIYSSFGGIRATIQTDAFQFVNFVILIPILALLLIFDEQFSWQAFQAHSSTATEVAFDAQTASGILGMLFYWTISSAGLDAPIIGRFLASKNVKVITRATAMAGVFTVLWIIIMVFIGSAGAFLHPEIADNDQVLLHIAENHFPGFLYGIFIIAMIGVVMSTQDTTMNTAGVVFSEDVVGGFNEKISDEKKLFYSKAFTFFIGIVAIFVAGFLDSILNAVIVIFSFYIPVMTPLTLFSVLKKNHHWQSAIAGMIAGFVSYLYWENFGNELIPAIIIGLAFNFLFYLGTDFILKNKQ